MRRLLLCMALAVASARPLDAETLLYSSAASQNRIDIYRIRDDGSPSPDKIDEKFLGGIRPRRLIARTWDRDGKRQCRLFVAEQDRVEVFRIGPRGGLELIGATRARPDTRPHDIELYPETETEAPKTLVVPIRKRGAIAAYPLDAEGRPSFHPRCRAEADGCDPADPNDQADLAEDQQGTILAGHPANCVYGPSGADWEDMEVQNGKLYATFSSRLDVYGIAANPRCSNSNNPNETCTTDADCRRCTPREIPSNIPGDPPVIRFACADTAIFCDADQGGGGDERKCAGTCENDIKGERPHCTNAPNIECVADTDCGAVCVPGLFTTARMEDNVDECPPYSITEAKAESCLDPTLDRPERPGPSCPFSSRGRIAGGVGLALAEKVMDPVTGEVQQTLLVGMRFTRRIQGFVLDKDGNLPEIVLPTTSTTVTTTTGPNTTTTATVIDVDKERRKRRKAERKSRKCNRTGQTIRYIGLTLHHPSGTANPIIYGAGVTGRIDAFRLEPNETQGKKCQDNPKTADVNEADYVPLHELILPKKISGSTRKDVVSTPIRTFVKTPDRGDPVLYVAAGERDRIQAYRLLDQGGIDPDQSPMQTNAIDGSFPNDVVLVDISSCD